MISNHLDYTMFPGFGSPTAPRRVLACDVLNRAGLVGD